MMLIMLVNWPPKASIISYQQDMSRRNAAVASNLILKKELNNERGYFGELMDRVKKN